MAEPLGQLDPQPVAVQSVGVLIGSLSLIAGMLPLAFGGRFCMAAAHVVMERTIIPHNWSTAGAPMPLAFTAIDRRDPEGNVSVVGIPLQAHEYIMLAAHDLDLKLLFRLDDYWKDTAYESDELDQLRTEVAQVRQSLSPQEPEADLMADLFTGMDLVITAAQRVGGYVEAIAD